MNIMIGGLSLFVWLGWAFAVIALIVFVGLVYGLYISGRDPEAEKAKKEAQKELKATQKANKGSRKKGSIVVKGAKISKEDQVHNVFGARVEEPSSFNPTAKKDFNPIPGAGLPQAQRTGNFDSGVPETQPAPGSIPAPPKIGAPRPNFSPPGMNRPEPLAPKPSPASSMPGAPAKVVLPPGMRKVDPSLPNAEELQHLLDDENKEDELFTRFKNKGL